MSKFVSVGDYKNEKEKKIVDDFKLWLKRASLDTKPYQIDGIRWAFARECSKSHPLQGKAGGIIADEMGLGKTILMIGIMLVNFKRRTLIVLPPALLKQWESEIKRLTGHLPLVYHGYQKTKITPEQFMDAPVIITTYGMVSKKERNPLLLLKWGRIIFDEAHHLRNQQKIHKQAMKLRSEITWLVTGTPIQNSMLDLNSLWKMLKIKASMTELYIGDDSLGKTLIDGYMLRRTKAQVGLKLPEIKDKIVNVAWESKCERDVCEEIHAALDFSNSSYEQGPIIAEMTRHILGAMVRCRQMCVKPELLRETFDDLAQDIIQDETKSQLSGFTNKSKINAVVKKIVERKDNGRRKLVFSHFRGEIDEIKKQLEGSGLRVAYFDGRVSSHTRELLLDEDKMDVLILQIKTACEGLNLQQFKEIYLVTPHWNPAVEDQAIARCHRIGQTDEINVFRFIMDDFGTHTKTIDGYSRDIQERKRKFQEILN